MMLSSNPIADINDLTLEKLKSSFSSEIFTRGCAIVENKGVLNSQLSKEKDVLAGQVAHTNDPNPFTAYAILNEENGCAVVKGMCTCHVGANCPHVAALLIAHINSNKNLQIPKDSRENAIPIKKQETKETAGWLESLDKRSEFQSKEILFLLEFHEMYGRWFPSVAVYDVNIKKNGAYGAKVPFKWKLINEKKHLIRAQSISDEDHLLLHHLQVHAGADLSEEFEDFSIRLKGKEGARLLKELLNTNRCFASDKWMSPLRYTNRQIEGSPVWKTIGTGDQVLSIESSKKSVCFVYVDPLCYFDQENLVVGPVNIELPEKIAYNLLNAPPIHPCETSIVSKKLLNTAPMLPSIRVFETAVAKTEKPTPILYLHSEILKRRAYFGYSFDRKETSFAVPLFQYGNEILPYNFDQQEVFSYENEILTQFSRQKKFEDDRIQELISLNLKPLLRWEEFFDLSPSEKAGFVFGSFYSNQKEIDQSWNEFLSSGIKQLKAKGWRIEVDSTFAYPLISSPDEWFAEIYSPSGENWFEMELGVLVEGEKVNLLPLILKILKNSPETIKALENLDKCLATLPDGRSLEIPADRMRTILGYLKNFYDINRIGKEGRIPFQSHQAAELAAIQELMESGKSRWHGGEKLIELGRKLKDFKQIESVSPPAQFQTDLKEYQKEGLNWLQFLREYQLNGILADDMGLGKTVQVLAHLTLEKEAGRLSAPCLVVAPTSLVGNWASEAARFSPGLKVLALHGANRNALFESIQEYDIVITTYALLHRDQKILNRHSFYYMILDEAQSIKNAASKVSRHVNKLQASHRLCMTGTPLENHLGELWSLFHFLMPGFLGDIKDFGRFFRKPIEIEGDNGKREALVRRISPFILRRTKDDVLAQLPAKTEITKVVEMEQDQLDLYEAIRIGMHEKIQNEIEKNGIAKSQIYLLEGLLKLRQVCCDPRLVKMNGKNEKISSAKLELLMQFLPEMIEEGRKILLFSQFTSMLELIEDELVKRGISYVKLTGSTVDRAAPIAQFQEKAVPLFLISLKAGGVGLNLTAADTVIHYDPWWNPAAEKQATDRAHRMGQEKPVFVYKLLTKGTVEEKINRMQERKQDLAEGVLSGKSSKTSALTQEDIQVLFQPIHSTV